VRTVREPFPGVSWVRGHLTTRNLVPGERVYGERLLEVEGVEYRVWNPRRSKLAAAFFQGLETFPLEATSRVLYLGAGSGTTASHLSDLLPGGRIFCIERSPRVFSSLLDLSTRRENLAPILGDARRPQEYASLVEACEVLYQDLAQPRQVEIFLENAELYLERDGIGFLAIKARSIDVIREPQALYREVVSELTGRGFRLLELLDLNPYERDHAFAVLRKTG
jgi:fibrillarin-like pre-rRNA processing protein